MMSHLQSVAKSVTSITLLVLILFSSGCDTLPETQNAETAALFTGTWPMQELTDDEINIDVGSGEAGFTVVFKFRVNFTFEFEIDNEASEGSIRITGSYVISDDSFIIELDASVPGQGKVPLIFAYEFLGEGAPDDNGPNELKLYAEGETVESLNLILGTNLIGVVILKLKIESRLT